MEARRWDAEREPADAPVWLSAEEATAWAQGYNAAVRAARWQTVADRSKAEG